MQRLYNSLIKIVLRVAIYWSLGFFLLLLTYLIKS